MSRGVVHDAYAALAAKEGFTRDRRQEQAADKLEDLRARLIGNPREFTYWARRLRRLLPGQSTLAPVRGIYLWGGVGRGKTLLMDLFYEALPFADRERRHFHRFMRDAHDDLRKLKDRTYPLESVAHNIARRTRIVCFDEFQVSDIADAMILGTLLDALFRRGVTLVATSNVAPRDLYHGGLQRERFLPAIALIERHTSVLHLEGATDYRLRQLKQAPIYLPSGAADTHERLSRWFASVAGGPGTDDGAVTIEHRRIRCVRRSEAVLWFEFREICEGPRSQNDYIELARLCHTLIVANVPLLEATHDNAARRFIALVDELYDRNVNLILSAAAAPHELYRGEKLRFDFQRTSSRLIEMQTEAYLARAHRP
ncbi:MAG TPA: cell division protein ZapE [Steroidobacteraceae bacterium]|jgi:cell division protein ZapE|nr:cell division protein ZapE [Steroidobacteraceae bacterium]